MSASYKFEGMAELKRKLAEVGQGATGKSVQSGLRAAGKVIKAAVVAAAPYDGHTDDGVHIRENIVVGRSRSQSIAGQQEVFTVGVKYGRGERKDTATNRKLNRVGKKFKTEGDAFYWKFHEFGTAHQPARPFIRPAFEASRESAAKAFEVAMAKAIKRLEKQGSK